MKTAQIKARNTPVQSAIHDDPPDGAERDASIAADMLVRDEHRIRVAFRIAYVILLAVPVLICLLLYAQGARDGTHAHARPAATHTEYGASLVLNG